jgi:hypothetical protein
MSVQESALPERGFTMNTLGKPGGLPQWSRAEVAHRKSRSYRSCIIDRLVSRTTRALVLVPVPAAVSVPMPVRC